MYRLWNYGIFLWDFLTSLCETVDPPHIYIQYMVYFAFLFGCFEREWGGLVQRKSCKHMKRRESKKKMGLGFSFSLFTVPHFLTIIWKNILNKHFLSCFDEKLQGKANEAKTIDSSKILRICVPRVMNTVVGNSVSLQCNVYWDMGWDYIEFLLLGSKFLFLSGPFLIVQCLLFFDVVLFCGIFLCLGWEPKMGLDHSTNFFPFLFVGQLLYDIILQNLVLFHYYKFTVKPLFI